MTEHATDEVTELVDEVKHLERRLAAVLTYVEYLESNGGLTSLVGSNLRYLAWG
jgi:hypothetical protein